MDQWFSTFFGPWTIFRKYLMDHFAMRSPREQLVKHKNRKIVLHNVL